MSLLPIELAVKALLIAVGTAAVLRIVNVKTAAARHAAWAGVMVVMLLLPLWTVWGPKVALRLLPPRAEQTATHAIAAPTLEPAALPEITRSADSTPAPRQWTWTGSLLGIYLVGVVVFLARLALGTRQAQLLVRRALHRDGRLFSVACAAPVTVGWLRPVMVLPESWSRWPAAQLDAVLTHEQEHARRRDPLFQWLALLNRAVFWFHPLAWWLERRIAALAEEACDAVVLARGHDPRDYSKYLIDLARSVATSGARVQVWGMAMPGGFLEQRIRRILEGGPLPQLSRARMVCAGIACAVTSVAFATGALDRQRPAPQPERIAPLVQPQATRPTAVPVSTAPNLLLAQSRPQATTRPAAPVAVADAPGVTVSGVDRIIHRDPVDYPADARAKGIEGTIILAVTLAPDGSVSDAAVIGGPVELRKAALSSVLKWHFSPEAAPRQQVSVQFSLPASNAAAATAPAETPKYRVGGGVLGGIVNGVPRELPAPASTAPLGGPIGDVPRTLHVDIQGLSPEAAADLRQRLALREGLTFDHAAFVKELERIHQIVTEFDPHLSDSRMMGKAPRKLGPDGKVLPPDRMDATLIIAPRDSAQQPAQLEQYSRVAKPPENPLETATITLHLDIQGLSPEATADLRQRLAIRDGETTDSAGLRQTVARVRQVLKEFYPRLTNETHFDFSPRKVAPDGKPAPWDSANATIVIKR